MTQRELVERMLDADFNARNAGDWRNMSPEDQKRMQEGMSSALKVAVDELLGPYHYCTSMILERRRQRLEPKPPTLADRVMPILDKWFTQHSEETQWKVAEEIASLMKKEES